MKQQKISMALDMQLNNQLQLFLHVHKHRVFRGFFIIILFLHLILLAIPQFKITLPSPQWIRDIFKIAGQLWPFPTYQMLTDENLYIRQILMKTLEISVILLYTVDLLPKIFIWRQSTLWKLVNILILSLMMFQLPATIIAFGQTDQVKTRLFSISLCFILVCEIFSIREQKTLRILQINEKQLQKQHRFKEYSWCEIIKHDKPDDMWIVIDGKVYDISNFDHPGGLVIEDGAGGDCTALWYSYHPSYLINQGPPQKYLIGQVRDYVQYYKFDGEFYKSLKEDVEQISRNDGYFQIQMKAIFWLVVYLFTVYYHITVNTAFTAILFGITAAQADVNIMHDGNHMAFSRNKTLSYIAGYVLDLTFSTSVVYRRSHNFGHHSCVNHLELDRGLDTTFPMIRLHPLQPKLWYHKYQHLYVWLVYGMVNFGDLFGTFDEMRSMSNYPIRRGYISNTQIIMQAIVKIAWINYSLFIPWYFSGYQHAFKVFFLQNISHSYNYVLYFLVNHWTEEAGVVDNSSISQTNWGVLQVQNSSNFANDSWFWTNVSGGLNFQIEHHLFPQLPHTMLPKVKKIVEERARVFNIPYSHYSSFWSALKSHYNLLKKLGN